jgi:hypothetical protein
MVRMRRGATAMWMRRIGFFLHRKKLTWEMGGGCGGCGDEGGKKNPRLRVGNRGCG